MGILSYLQDKLGGILSLSTKKSGGGGPDTVCFLLIKCENPLHCKGCVFVILPFEILRNR